MFVRSRFRVGSRLHSSDSAVFCCCIIIVVKKRQACIASKRIKSEAHRTRARRPLLTRQEPDRGMGSCSQSFGKDFLLLLSSLLLLLERMDGMSSRSSCVLHDPACKRDGEPASSSSSLNFFDPGDKPVAKSICVRRQIPAPSGLGLDADTVAETVGGP